MSRAVVTPACKSAMAFCTAMSIEASVVLFAVRVLNMCVCASINPGRTVARLKSMTRTPAGIVTWPSGPTSVMRSPEIRTTCFVSIWPVVLLNNRPARTASDVEGGAHLYTPPSVPTHGVAPAPRQGVVIGCP